MNISVTAIKDGVVSGLSTAGKEITKAAFWLGRNARAGAVALKDAMVKVWAWAVPHIKAGALKLFELMRSKTSEFVTFMKTPNGWGPTGAIAAVLGGVIGGFGLVKLGENADKQWKKTAFQIAGLSVAVVGGVGATVIIVAAFA